MTENKPEPENSDDVRRKFQEALRRKKEQSHAAGGGASGDGSGKSHGGSGPARSQRTFRRKSG